MLKRDKRFSDLTELIKNELIPLEKKWQNASQENKQRGWLSGVSGLVSRPLSLRILVLCTQ